MAVALDTKIQSLKGKVSAEEWQIRTDLAAMYRLVHHYGWDDMIFTHISARVPGPEHHFLINPYGLLFDEITASSLVKIDTEGNKLEPSPYDVNPAGFTIHSALHMSSENANFVVHTHTTDGCAVAAQEGGLLPLTQHAMLILGQIAYHDFEGVALDLDERERLIADMGDKTMMILRNHGNLAVGKTAGDAFLRLYYLERACSMQVRAQVAPLNKANQGVEQKTAGTGNVGFDGFIGALAWPGLIRMLDRKDPSYRT